MLFKTHKIITIPTLDRVNIGINPDRLGTIKFYYFNPVVRGEGQHLYILDSCIPRVGHVVSCFFSLIEHDVVGHIIAEDKKHYHIKYFDPTKYTDIDNERGYAVWMKGYQRVVVGTTNPILNLLYSNEDYTIPKISESFQKRFCLTPVEYVKVEYKNGKPKIEDETINVYLLSDI